MSPPVYPIMAAQMEEDSWHPLQHPKGQPRHANYLQMTPSAWHDNEMRAHLAGFPWPQALLIWYCPYWSSGVL